MHITEQEKKDLDRKMIFHGYSEFQTDFFHTPAFKRLRETMLDYLPYQDEKLGKIDLMPKSGIIQAGKFVIEKHFGTVDTRVLYTNGDDLESQLFYFFGEKPKLEQYNEIIDYINSHVSLIPVTDIPLYLDLEDLKNGEVVTPLFYGSDSVEDDFFKNAPVCVNEIKISGSCDEISQCIYIHEMMHALIDSHKGNIQNMLCNEMPSIFMESVGAIDIDPSMELYHLNNFHRIISNKLYLLDRDLTIFTNTDFDNVLEEEIYLYSSLLASSLFQIYLKGSEKIKREIDRTLAKVFMGDEVLEDMLSHFEATPEKGCKIMQKQIKDYHQRYNRIQ